MVSRHSPEDKSSNVNQYEGATYALPLKRIDTFTTESTHKKAGRVVATTGRSECCKPPCVPAPCAQHRRPVVLVGDLLGVK